MKQIKNNTLCAICQRVRAYDETGTHQCTVLCGGDDTMSKLETKL